jgi:hypothetical protein
MRSADRGPTPGNRLKALMSVEMDSGKTGIA